MKNVISYLCRIPGIFIITSVVIFIATYLNWDKFDERWWMHIAAGIVVTVIANLYLFFISEGVPDTNLRWVSLLLMIAMTIMSVGLAISLTNVPSTLPATDVAIQTALAETLSGILIWAWFTMFWNKYTVRYISNPKTKIGQGNTMKRRIIN
jgi:uncharacterized membrane protein